VALEDLTGAPVERAHVLERWLEGMARSTEPVDAERLLATYRARSSTIGRRVRVEVADGWFEGRALDVDADGTLCVDVGGVPRSVTAGDVVHLRGV
jgi:BirA family biotin operon repressor/biotin-[acetyl-CoA-carboxylase] ligase